MHVDYIKSSLKSLLVASATDQSIIFELQCEKNILKVSSAIHYWCSTDDRISTMIWSKPRVYRRKQLLDDIKTQQSREYHCSLMYTVLQYGFSPFPTLTLQLFTALLIFCWYQCFKHTNTDLIWYWNSLLGLLHRIKTDLRSRNNFPKQQGEVNSTCMTWYS